MTTRPTPARSQRAEEVFSELLRRQEAGQRLPKPIARLVCGGVHPRRKPVLAEIVETSNGPLLVEDGVPGTERVVRKIDDLLRHPPKTFPFAISLSAQNPQLLLVNEEQANGSLQLRCAKHRLSFVTVDWIRSELRRASKRPWDILIPLL